MLQAYVDNSASDSGDRRLFLAGYINTTDKWSLFSQAWKEELEAAPAIDYLKMSEAGSLTGQFDGWSREDRDDKVRGLARVVRHFQPVSIHASVSRAEVTNILKPIAPYGFANPYFYCFQAVMFPLAVSQLKHRLREPVAFTFDDQQGLGEEAKYIYKLVRDFQPKRIRNLLAVDPNFGNDKLVRPLQAADMLAWHVRRQAESGNADRWFVPDYLSVEDGYHICTDIQAEQLRGYAHGYSQIPGTSQLRSKGAWKKTMREFKRLSALGLNPPPPRNGWVRAISLTRRIFAKPTGVSS